MLSIMSAVSLSITAFAQESPRSNYVFRYSPSDSAFFLEEMTFPESRPLDLGACTVSEKLNGPLHCAINCDDIAVCLYLYNGPSGQTVNDVLEKVSEIPVTNQPGNLSARVTPVEAPEELAEFFK